MVAGLTVDLALNKACYKGDCVRLSPMQAEVLYILRERYPGVTDFEALIKGIYGILTPPDSADYNLRERVKDVRAKLRDLGLGIVFVGNNRSKIQRVRGWKLSVLEKVTNAKMRAKVDG